MSKGNGALAVLGVALVFFGVFAWMNPEKVAGVVNKILPRGLRINNPLNIEKTKPGFDRWQGEIDSPDARFAAFADMASGCRAAAKLLKNYRVLYGLDTVRGIVNRWSNPAESPDKNAGYIAHVAGLLKVSPDQKIDVHARLGELVAAMGKHEQGTAAFVAVVKDADLRAGVSRALA